MKTIRTAILITAALITTQISGPVNGQTAAVKRLSPSALVSDLYRAHRQKGSPFFQTRNRALLYKYFVKTLAELIWKDVVSSKGEVGVIDGDPLYDAQDMKITSFAVGKPIYENGKAKVTVSFENFRQKKMIVFLLANGRAGWRVSDIDYGEGRTLLGEFKEPR